MKKLFLLFLLASFSLPGIPQVCFYDNFSNGLANFTTYNADGLVPYFNFFDGLFGTKAPYKAWVAKDNCAYSISMYKPAGKSNDWLVTTLPISIPSVSGTISLTWYAKTYDDLSKDSYKVFISTSGNKISDFTDNAALSVSEENSYWTFRKIDLSKYAGRQIYIAFVNDSYNCYMLSIKDIFVGGTSFSVIDETPQNIYDDETTVCGSIQNDGATIIDTINVKYTCGGITYPISFTNADLQIDQRFTFSFAPAKIEAPTIGEPVKYILEVTANSISKTATGSVTKASFKPLKKVVVEEETGTWCGFSPRGEVYHKKLAEKYPDTFIRIAIHYNDSMECALYYSGVSQFISGFPEALIDRAYYDDPANYDYYYKQIINAFTPASLSLNAVFLDETKKNIALTSKIVFNTKYDGNADFRIAFVVIENDVTGFTQNNAFSGGEYGIMGGFEKLPDPVPANQMIFQNVARGIFDSFNGISGSIPSSVNINEEIRYAYTLKLPVSVTNIYNSEIIALLIDNRTGQIKNADKVKLSDLTANETIRSSNPDVRVGYGNSQIVVNVTTKSSGLIKVKLFNIDGKMIYTSVADNESNNRFVIPSDRLKGVYIITIQTPDGSINKKIIL
jgi:hypothetical protein